MYRVFCESYKNLLQCLSAREGKGNARLASAEPLALLCDRTLFDRERDLNTRRYRLVADLLYHLASQEASYPSAQAFLWTLSSRNIVGCLTGEATQQELDEMSRLVVMLLKLTYWEEVGHHEERTF